MDGNGSIGDAPRRIEVDPSDVRVVVSESYAYGAPPPNAGTPLPFLRRHRAKIALALAIVELLILGFGPGGYLHQWIGLLAIAVAAVFLYVLLRQRLPYALRQALWIVAVMQSLVALFPIFLGVSAVIVGILIVFAILAGLALILGDRR